MAGRRKVALRIAVVLGGIAVALTAGWLHLTWRLSTGLRTLPVEPFEAILKKVGTDIVVVKQPNASGTQSPVPPGYLVAYEQNPEGFKADAKLFDTWRTALELATFVFQNGPSGNWVKSSSAIGFSKPENRFDAWGHPLCLLRRGDKVLAISGGPSAPSSPTCKDIRMSADDLAQFPKMKLLQSKSGSLILVADKAAPPMGSLLPAR